MSLFVPFTGGSLATASRSIAHETSDAMTLSRAVGNPRFFPANTDRAKPSTMTSSFLSLNNAGFLISRMDSVHLNCRIDKVVTHSANSFCADGFHVAVVRLLRGQMAIDKSLSDVEDNSIGELPVRVHPPGIFVIPHPDSLGVPFLIFALGVPASDVNIVHSTVVKRRTFRFVTLGGHVAGRHVANPQDRQIADFSLGDERPHILVIPRVSVEQINRDEPIAGLDFLDQLPFRLDIRRQRFLGDDMFFRLQRRA